VPLVPGCAPLKPNVWLCPGAIEPFQGALVTVTCAPCCVTVELQACVTLCPDGNVNVRRQPSTGVADRLRTITFAVNPVFQVLAPYVTLHVPAGGVVGSGVGVAVAVGVGVGVGVGVTPPNAAWIAA